MTNRYEARKSPLTALQRRFFPENADKPFVVWDTKQNKAVGRRYGNETGAIHAADMRNRQKRLKRQG